MISPESDAGSRLVWFRSSYSNGAGGECVECALTDDSALVRDSKMTETYGIAVSGDAWSSFVRNVKRTGAKWSSTSASAS
ncbi:DUF397 domain-containing protein [Streptomyces sp. NPDC088801]|uniref:DUF397 domain-containing protein n=1 Tax=Streptomyces sp. NPDC088801 TaxID=3365903 RepID=UPI0037F901F5